MFLSRSGPISVWSSLSNPGRGGIESRVRNSLHQCFDFMLALPEAPQLRISASLLATQALLINFMAARVRSFAVAASFCVVCASWPKKYVLELVAEIHRCERHRACCRFFH